MAKANAVCKAYKVTRTQLIICTGIAPGDEFVRKFFTFDRSQVIVFIDEAA